MRINKTRRAHQLASRFLAGACLAAMLTAQAAYAEDAADEGEDTAIVVVARGRAEKLIDVPVAASVATPEDLRRNDISSVANLKIVVPQISLDRGFTGSGTSIAMRGVSSTVIDAGVEQSVLLDFDGVAISRGRILNDALFDLAGVDVLKGPQPVFFGKNSPGGVVSVKSADPTSDLSGFVRGGYEFNARATTVETAISGPLSDNLGARLALFASQSKGYIRNMNRGVADPFVAAGSPYGFIPAAPERLGAEEKIAGRFTLKYTGDDLTASFKLLVSRYEGQGLQSFSEVMGCAPGQTVPIDRVAGVNYADPTGDCRLNDRSSQGWINPAVVANWPEVNRNGSGQPYSKNVTVMPVLRLTKGFGDIEVTSVTGYYDYDYVSQGNADATAYSFFWSYSNEKNKSFYQEVRAVSDFAGPLNFAAGGHYEYNDRTLFVGGLNGRTGLDATTGKLHTYDNQQGNKSSAFSIFGQLRYEPSEQLELAAGGRYTRQTKKLDTVFTFVNSNQAGFRAVGNHITGRKTEDNFSPEVTVSYKPSSNVMVYAAYKTGYLAGGFSNPGVPAASSTSATLSFDAETVNGFEVGVKGSTLGNTLTGSITGYRYVYKGLPLTSLVTVGSIATYRTQNAADTLAQGVELEATWRPAAGTRLNATASYNDAKFRSFPGAQCYAGQTVATGCVVVTGTTTTTQDLSGKDVYRSPDWILTAGASQEFALSSSLNLTANADVRYTSSYNATIGLNPVGFQKSFTTLNASLRLSTPDDKWGLALIGRNLTNVRYATLGVDKPGGVGDVFAVAGEPRAVVLQAEVRF